MANMPVHLLHSSQDNHYYFTTGRGGLHSSVMSIWLSVRLSARITRKPHGRTSFSFMDVACDRSSVLLSRRCELAICYLLPFCR